ncbi:MAG: hypothetical protein HOY75_32655 [Streptomyces sp.]|nr:hypothetical protein [Streptomyces sp.]
MNDAADGAGTAPKATSSQDAGTGPCARTARRSCAPAPPLPRRRRRLVAGPASVCAVLATPGALSTLPDVRRRP